jgi:ureidoglycolate hydrolase
MVHVAPLTKAGFAPYGEVLEAHEDRERDEVVAHWSALARQRYGGEIKPLSLSLPARVPELSFIEAHPNSPQLSVAFDSPWILTVVPGIVPGSAVGRDADVSSARAFLVQPGTAVILKAGLWHGPVTSLGDTDALVVFREGVVDEWTELDRPVRLEVADRW